MATKGSSGNLVCVGSGNGGIHVFKLAAGAQTLEPSGVFEAGDDPSFLAMGKDGRHLYAVDELQNKVRAFEVAEVDGKLWLLPQGEVEVPGDGPTHLCVDPSGQFVLVACYGSGTVASFPIIAGGTLGAAVSTASPGRNAHQVVPHPQGRFVYVPCLGSDLVAVLALDPKTGALRLSDAPPLTCRKGSGPRHLAFAPDGRSVFLLHELSGALSGVAVDAQSGRLHTLCTISTLPDGFTAKNTAAEIAVHPEGARLLVSNRGLDALGLFAIEAGGSALRPLGRVPTEGSHPRSFALSPDGKIALVANEKSHTLTAFSLSDAAIEPLGEWAKVEKPRFVGIWARP